MSYWGAATIALAAVIVFLSLVPSSSRHRVAVICYTVIAAGSAGMAVFPMFFGISMANAFGPSQVPLLGYVVPLLTFALILLPAVLLWLSAKCCHFIALLMFGAAILFSVGYAIYSALRWHGYADSGYGLRAVFYLLLWLRIHDMRVNFTDQLPNDRNA